MMFILTPLKDSWQPLQTLWTTAALNAGGKVETVPLLFGSLPCEFTGRIQSAVDENGVGAAREAAPLFEHCVLTHHWSPFGSLAAAFALTSFRVGMWPAEPDESVLLSDWTRCFLPLSCFRIFSTRSVFRSECACLCILNLVYRAAEKKGGGVGTGEWWWFCCFARLQPPVCVSPPLPLFVSPPFFSLSFPRACAGTAGGGGPGLLGRFLPASHGWWLMALKANVLFNQPKDTIVARKHVPVQLAVCKIKKREHELM